MRPLYFGSRYFAGGFFGAPAESFGGYFGAGHFGANYFGAGFYGPVTIISSGAITATLDATEAADTLESAVTVPGGFIFGAPPRRRIHPRLEPISAKLDVTERADTCESTVTLGFDPVEMDNNLLLIAA